MQLQEPIPTKMNTSPTRSRRGRFLATRTVTFLDDGPWGPDVDVENEKGYVESRGDRFPGRLCNLAYQWFQFQFALRLLRRCRAYEGVAVGRYGIWFPILHRWLRLPGRVVMTDTEWRVAGSGRLNHAAALASDAVCCNTHAEIERYSRHFRIPIKKFRLVRMAFQRPDIFEATDEGYVFAGGTQGRDWETLLRAVEGLPYPVRILTPSKFPAVPPNVTVERVSRQEYYRRMAAASCVVVPLLPEPLRITGTTTWINAMGTGKVVIVTEPHGAPDYMEQGVSGFYVDYGDSHTLRQRIQHVMSDAELRRRVGHAARERALREFSPEIFRRSVLALLRGDDIPATARPS
jgi:glycosyltransferase involved in cell wall biosynthesis